MLRLQFDSRSRQAVHSTVIGMYLLLSPELSWALTPARRPSGLCFLASPERCPLWLAPCPLRCCSVSRDPLCGVGRRLRGASASLNTSQWPSHALSGRSCLRAACHLPVRTQERACVSVCVLLGLPRLLLPRPGVHVFLLPKELNSEPSCVIVLSSTHRLRINPRVRVIFI